MKDWEEDKKWSDRFIPEIQTILANNLRLFEIANDVEDREHNTDLLTLRDIRVALRIRKFDAFQSFGNQFTIRSRRGSGAKTELLKIIEGLGRYMFYGFSDESERKIHAWFLIDLNAFRGWIYESEELLEQPGVKLRTNNDGTGTKFLAFNVEYIKPGIIIARSETKWM